MKHLLFSVFVAFSMLVAINQPVAIAAESNDVATKSTEVEKSIDKKAEADGTKKGNVKKMMRASFTCSEGGDCTCHGGRDCNNMGRVACGGPMTCTGINCSCTMK